MASRPAHTIIYFIIYKYIASVILIDSHRMYGVWNTCSKYSKGVVKTILWSEGFAHPTNSLCLLGLHVGEILKETAYYLGASPRGNGQEEGVGLDLLF